MAQPAMAHNVALFITCLTDQFYPHVGVATTKILEHCGCTGASRQQQTCCGFGGTFAVKYPAISGAIVEDKVNCIQATGAEITICNDAGCTMNISGMCHRAGVTTSVKHIAEVMAEAMGLDLKKW